MKVKLEDRPDNLNRSDRPQRQSINGRRDVLNVRGKEQGWHYIWVNDYNVDAWLEGGYEFVVHNVVVGSKKIDASICEGGKISKPVGNGVTGYLMRCPQEIKDEEDALVDDKTDEADISLRQSLNSNEDGRYGEVEIKESKPISRRRGMVVR
jgi:hypothetical protein